MEELACTLVSLRNQSEACIPCDFTQGKQENKKMVLKEAEGGSERVSEAHHCHENVSSLIKMALRH